MRMFVASIQIGKKRIGKLGVETGRKQRSQRLLIAFGKLLDTWSIHLPMNRV